MVPITVIFAQDDTVGNKREPPEQVIQVDGIEYRTRSPDVIASLFSGSEEEDTDALSIATDEWLYWVNHYIEHDEDVRAGLLEALGEEFPAIKLIADMEK